MYYLDLGFRWLNKLVLFCISLYFQAILISHSPVVMCWHITANDIVEVLYKPSPVQSKGQHQMESRSASLP